MKLLVMPSSIDEIKNSLDYCDAYLIGINGLSVNNNMSVDIDDIDNIISIIGNKELFINVNMNMSNNDIEILKIVMKKLNNYNIKGIFYYDVGIVNIYNSGEYNYDLVWASEHATTNYNTINYWNKFGVDYCLVSSDITLNEVLNIKNNCKCKIIVPIFGYQSMFNSKRHIVKNYLDYFNIIDNSSINYMEKEGKFYPIIDSKDGTEVYTNYILNGLKEYDNLQNNNIDYVLLNSFNIDDDKFLEVLNIINDKNYDKVYELFVNLDDGFLYKETVARVKKNEK